MVAEEHGRTLLESSAARADELADGLADQLATLARNLRLVTGIESILDEVVRAGRDLIPSAAHASISLVRSTGQVESRAATGNLPRLIDALQSEIGQGPCLDAAFVDRVVRVPDLSDEPRWPRFAPPAWAAGGRSMLCVQFFIEGRELGALNLYGREVGDFGEECEEVALLVATHAAIALAEASDIHDLNDALAERDIIGQAKGVLMERYKLSAHQAFLLLAEAASSRNATMVEMAAELTATGIVSTRSGRKNL